MTTQTQQTQATKYFLYIPVWATTQQPSGSESASQSGPSQSTESASSVMSSDDLSSGSETGGVGSSGVGSSGVGSSGVGSSGGTDTPFSSETSRGSSGGRSSGGLGPGGPGGLGPGGPGGPGPGGPGGTGPGGIVPSGTKTGESSNCLLYGTLVTMADGRRVPIELLAPGDMVLSLVVPGLKTDVPFCAQYEWMSTWGLAGASIKPARVASVRLGEHDGFYLINGRIKATFEHPFLIRRDHFGGSGSSGSEAWGFCSAELLRIGDVLITREPLAADNTLAEERIITIERIPGRVRTVALHVPGTNTYLADGVWTHNDQSSGPMFTAATLSGSSESSSGSGSKSSGSSFSSSG